jgi:hypothetical protein
MRLTNEEERMTVDVELTRPCDTDEVLAALAAQGLAGEVGDDCHVTVQADDLAQVELALDTWAWESGLPFVPFQVDERSIVLAPASA